MKDFRRFHDMQNFRFIHCIFDATKVTKKNAELFKELAIFIEETFVKYSRKPKIKYYFQAEHLRHIFIIKIGDTDYKVRTKMKHFYKHWKKALVSIC